MVENQKDGEVAESKVLFAKVIPKMNKAGSRQVGSMTVELKTFDGVKFVQLTQTKEAYGKIGTEGYKPAKSQWITFDPSNKQIVDSIIQACK